MPSLKALCLVGLLASLVSAENWPHWRGPHGDGTAPGKGYPLKWSPTENVKWKYTIPGEGASTPAIWGDRIYLTAAIDGKNHVICLDRAGNELWKTPLGTARPGKNRKATGCNPSVATDGRHAFAYFKSGDLGCLDPQGNVLWHTNLQARYGEDTLWWDLGTSPVLTEKYVVVAVMHSGPSYLVAFEKATGKVAWKQDRNLDAPEEAAQSYTTPIVTRQDGKERLIVLGADHVTCHDAATGKEIWRVGGLNPTQHRYFRSIASPVLAGDLVIAPYARGNTLTAIKLGGSGDVTSTHVAWTAQTGADVPTPTVQKDRIYLCSDRGQLSCLDAKSGRVIWSVRGERHRMNYSSSPVLAENRLYLTREDGTTFVYSAKDGELLVKNELDELTVATPVFADERAYIRTLKSLYCIEAP